MSNLFSRIKEKISEQINSYKKREFIRRSKTSSIRTIFATILYILSMIALIPSILHLLLDSAMHFITGSSSILFYNLSQRIRG